ncbi:MAG: OB-fold domain-containing protein [Natrialbaceae archaeon]|nr:OB-fold domain-containing protein [Natrialbaceae archaeon]
MQPWFQSVVDAIDASEPTYLECSACGSAHLPPRTVCPDCHSRSLSSEPLSTIGTVESHTTIAVPIPAFGDDAPYTIVLAGFEEGVRLTGHLATGSVEIGDRVSLGVARRTDGARYITFEPASSSPRWSATSSSSCSSPARASRMGSVSLEFVSRSALASGRETTRIHLTDQVRRGEDVERSRDVRLRQSTGRRFR